LTYNVPTRAFALCPSKEISREVLEERVREMNSLFSTRIQVGSQVLLTHTGVVLQTGLKFHGSENFLAGLVKGFGFHLTERRYSVASAPL
jgi:hypothetical protein